MFIASRLSRCPDGGIVGGDDFDIYTYCLPTSGYAIPISLQLGSDFWTGIKVIEILRIPCTG
jgi:hypothetical protein